MLSTFYNDKWLNLNSIYFWNNRTKCSDGKKSRWVGYFMLSLSSLIFDINSPLLRNFRESCAIASQKRSVCSKNPEFLGKNWPNLWCRIELKWIKTETTSIEDFYYQRARIRKKNSTRPNLGLTLETCISRLAVHWKAIEIEINPIIETKK